MSRGYDVGYMHTAKIMYKFGPIFSSNLLIYFRQNIMKEHKLPDILYSI